MTHNRYCRDCRNYAATHVNGNEIAAWCRHNDCRRTCYSEACPAYAPKRESGHEIAAATNQQNKIKRRR